MKHPVKIKGFDGNLEELARAITNMRYDSLQELLEHMSDFLEKDADTDKERGREKLATELYNAGEFVYQAKESIEAAWKISKPYMDQS